MTKVFLLLAALFLITGSTITFAKSENSSHGESGPSENRGSDSGKNQTQEDKNQGRSENAPHQETKLEPGAKAKPATALKLNRHEGSVSAKPMPSCAPENEWKNHGAYLSCVAKLKLGGQVVSEAARSDIGKKGATPSASFEPSPSSSESATPSSSPEESTESASPSASPVESFTAPVVEQFVAIKDLVGSFFHNLKHLFSF